MNMEIRYDGNENDENSQRYSVYARDSGFDLGYMEGIEGAHVERPTTNRLKPCKGASSNINDVRNKGP
jgi:hypothetical protein